MMTDTPAPSRTLLAECFEHLRAAQAEYVAVCEAEARLRAEIRMRYQLIVLYHRFLTERGMAVTLPEKPR